MSKNKKKDPEPLNILQAMGELPNMDLLRIALAANALLHDRAMIAQKEEAQNEKDNSKNADGPKLVVPNAAP